MPRNIAAKVYDPVAKKSRSITVYGATSADKVAQEIQDCLPWRTTKLNDRRHKRRL